MRWHDLSARLPRTNGWMHSGVAVLGDGRLVVAHPEGGSLLVVAPDGSTSQVATPLTEMHAIVRTVRDGVELLWVADNGHRYVPEGPGYVDRFARGRVVLLDLGGQVVQELACPALEQYAHGAWSPTSVVVDDDALLGSGDVWVADGYGASLLHRFRADGTFLGSVDGTSTGLGFDCPHGLMLRVVGARLELYVADRGNRRLVVLDGSGTYLRTVGVGALDSPSSLVRVGDRTFVTELFGGVAVLEGDVVVGTVEATRVRSSEEEGWPNALDGQQVVGPAVAPGTLNSPHGLASDGRSLFVTEWFVGGRLLRLDLGRPPG